MRFWRSMRINRWCRLYRFMVNYLLEDTESPCVRAQNDCLEESVCEDGI